jgi:hypothetical protein
VQRLLDVILPDVLRIVPAAAALAACELVFPYEPFEDAPPDGSEVCKLYDAEPGNCAGSLRDCNAQPADGCETSVDSDAGHCGYCGHACTEEACVDSWCDARTVATQTATGSVYSIGVNQGYLYIFAEDTRVVALEGGGEASIALGGPSTHFAFEGDFAYIVSFSPAICTQGTGWCVVASPIGSATTSPLGETLNYPYGLAASPDHVFFADEGDGGRVVRLDKTGGNETVMATQQGVIAKLAADATHVYWAGPNGVARLDAPAMAPQILAPDPATALALAGGSVYWASASSIARMPAGGGEVEVLVNRGADWIGVAVPYLYWAEGASLFRRVLCASGTDESVPGDAPAFVTSAHLYHTLTNETIVARRQH